MVLETKKATVAYRCPHCGCGVISVVDIFSLSADMIKLKCSCGQSELEVINRPDGKVRLKVPCMLCSSGHMYTVSKNLFFGRDLFVLPCPCSDINICFMGDENKVKAELARTELELLQILEDNGIDSFAALHGEPGMLTDPQILEIVLFVIRDLDAEGKIYCRCRPAPGSENTAEGESTAEGGENTDNAHAEGENAREGGESGEASSENGGADNHAEGEIAHESEGSAEGGESGDHAHANGENAAEGSAEGGESGDHAHAEGNYDVEITEDGIFVRCTRCGASRLIPTDSLLAAHAFLNTDALYLE